MTTAVEVAEKGHQLAAWVNFDGTGGAANKSGTYSQSGTTITFTFSTDHDLVVGSVMTIGFSSGAASQETFTVATVPSSTVMTATSASSRTTSGNFTAYYQPIRASFNVSSISENATGDYFVNFATAMPDANYSVNANGKVDIGVRTVNLHPSSAHILAGSVRVYAVLNSDAGLFSSDYCFVTIFR